MMEQPMSAVSVEQLGIVAGEIVLPITVDPFSGFGGRVAGPARASGPGLETGGRGCRFDQSCLVADTEKFADLSQFTSLVCQHVLVVDRKPPSVKDALSLPVVGRCLGFFPIAAPRLQDVVIEEPRQCELGFA